MSLIRENIEIISKIKKAVHDYNASEILYLTISGAHLYGFESEDSDIDYRGAFQLNTNTLLGLHTPRDVMEFNIDNNDVVLFELQKEVGLALKSNCNILEHMWSELLITSPEYLKLRKLIPICKNGLYNSYKGMATFNYKKFILSCNKKSVKKYLYVMRGLMAGTYALTTGLIEPNIEKLDKIYGSIPLVNMLIETKKNGKENDLLGENTKVENMIQDWFYAIDKAYENSKLEDKPNEDELKTVDQYLRSLRIAYLR